MRSPVSKNQDLHGNVPDSCSVVLLLVDVINDLDFPHNSALLKAVPALGSNISRLKSRCRALGIPAIYANDNRGRWRSEQGSADLPASGCFGRATPVGCTGKGWDERAVQAVPLSAARLPGG